MKITISRNTREGYYAGFYPAGIIDHPVYYAGHKRWPKWAMSEQHCKCNPRIHGVTWVNEMWDELEANAE